MKISAIIAAAGIGRRMGGTFPKQYLEICEKPIICHTLDIFSQIKCIQEVIIVVEPGREEFFRKSIIEKYNYPSSWVVVGGGNVRQESVANGLRCVSKECDVVLIHDGVRPFITGEQIENAANIAATTGAAILAFPIKETVKRVGNDGQILETVDRENLWGAQTPQAFKYSLLLDAMDKAIKDGFAGTDEASIVERLGTKVNIIKGDSRNIKITTPADLIIAEAILKDWNK